MGRVDRGRAGVSCHENTKARKGEGEGLDALEAPTTLDSSESGIWSSGRNARMNETRTWGGTSGPLVGCLLLSVFGISCFSSCTPEVKPLRDRRNAILLRLKEIASDTNTYRKTHGAFPKSRKGALLPNEGYRLIVADNGTSFLVVADRVFVGDSGSRIHFACDEKLRIQEFPVPGEQDVTSDKKEKDSPQNSKDETEGSKTGTR
jgi:hypothetical protein